MCPVGSIFYLTTLSKNAKIPKSAKPNIKDTAMLKIITTTVYLMVSFLVGQTTLANSALTSPKNWMGFMGLLPNVLFRRNCRISSGLAQINFDVYPKDKRKNFLGQAAEILQ